MRVEAIVRAASEQVQRRDAEVLLLHLLGRQRAWLLAHPEASVDDLLVTRFEALVQRRRRGEPMQYLIGVQEFLGMELRVTPAVLIPRPETELLVEAALRWAASEAAQGRPVRRAVDVGTGSGAIALGLHRALPAAQIWATDLSKAALAVAGENAARLEPPAKVQFLEGDLLAPLLAESREAHLMLDLVISNPPYIPLPDAPTLQTEVRDHEPHTALFAGDDGLTIYRRLIPEAAAALRPGGLLAMEFGFGQQPALEQLLRHWDAVQFLADYAGIPRIALAQNRGVEHFN